VESISYQDVFHHVQNLINISEQNSTYEQTRAKARDYIIEVLTTSQNGQKVFTGDQVLYHRFDWTVRPQYCLFIVSLANLCHFFCLLFMIIRIPLWKQKMTMTP
jgi:hypothetical protein